LRSSSASGLRKIGQAGVSTFGAFYYFAGDKPASIVIIAASWKKQARAL
jgi:hypothetical protein